MQPLAGTEDMMTGAPSGLGNPDADFRCFDLRPVDCSGGQVTYKGILEEIDADCISRRSPSEGSMGRNCPAFAHAVLGGRPPTLILS